MAALQIGRDLDLVDGEERDVEIARHRLDGRDPVARVRRLDLLLAGDQRDGVAADPCGDLVVDLARQQPQRQADHAGGMREHPLDGEMGLAGVGRPEHRGDAGARSAIGRANEGEEEKAIWGLGSGDWANVSAVWAGGSCEVSAMSPTRCRLHGHPVSRGSVSKPRGSGVLDAPVKPGHDSGVWRRHQIPRNCLTLRRFSRCGFKLRNDFRTNRGRIADSPEFCIRSPQHLAGAYRLPLDGVLARRQATFRRRIP